jgi:DNA-binding IscR family transcriptional regulator
VPLASPDSAAVRALRSVWKEVQAKEQRLLEETTLAELLRRTQQTSALTYQI